MTRDEATQELAEWITQLIEHGVPNYSTRYKALKLAIEALSAESVEGEWIVTEHCSNEFGFRKWIEIECPFCGERPTYENLDNMKYCPNCGAKMKGQGE